MALKIERVWSNLFSTDKVTQKDNQQRNDKQKDQQPKKDENKEQASDERAKDRAHVEKAAQELRETPSFQSTGMSVEVLGKDETITVRLTQVNGTTIKVMTAEEFLKLKDNTGKQALRGKILDQKF